MTTTNPFEVLGIRDEFILKMKNDKEKLEKFLSGIYKVLVKITHPDYGGEREEFEKIVEAFEEIKNIEKREYYLSIIARKRNIKLKEKLNEKEKIYNKVMENIKEYVISFFSDSPNVFNIHQYNVSFFAYHPQPHFFSPHQVRTFYEKITYTLTQYEKGKIKVTNKKGKEKIIDGVIIGFIDLEKLREWYPSENPLSLLTYAYNPLYKTTTNASSLPTSKLHSANLATYYILPCLSPYCAEKKFIITAHPTSRSSSLVIGVLGRVKKIEK